ncbi:MAG TPA: rRNA maturation RNase YbeY [Clostridia bacterium]|nr:rRNA maturation RNase YbeY [Clostridia bacterium]
MPISIINRQDKVPVTTELEALIREVAQRVLAREAVDPGLEVSVVLVDDAEIRELNRDYRGVDRATDVLSFAYREEQEEEPEVVDPAEEDVLGDIVISLERARAQAAEYGHSFGREVGFLVAHGMYHLLGFDHMTPDEEAVMRAREEAVLQDIGLVRE